MRTYWSFAVALAFLFGIAADRVWQRRSPRASAVQDQAATLAGIAKLHHLDERVTLLNDPKALQQLWTDDAVRLAADDPPDIGKRAIYATDMRAWADAPGFKVESYKPDIRDVQVVEDWAFEWGLFDAGYHASANKPLVLLHGKALRILHREPTGDWKFSRVMVAIDTPVRAATTGAATLQH